MRARASRDNGREHAWEVSVRLASSATQSAKWLIIPQDVHLGNSG
jgi:hypothetical protein